LTNKRRFTHSFFAPFLFGQPRPVCHHGNGTELAGGGGGTWLGLSFFLKLDDKAVDSLLLLGDDFLNETVKIV
jgi:hypothetical protein